MMLDTFQKHLDDVSATLMAGDFDAYMKLITVPLVVMTEKETVLVKDIEDFRTGFDSYAGMLRTELATDLIRLASAVTEYGPNLITGRYETHILRAGQRIYGPHQAAMTLRREHGSWKASGLVNPAFEERWPFKSIARREAGA